MAVVGHVEWVEFARVTHLPAAGEIVHAGESFAEPAGGGAVAAVQLARLAGTATFFTALGRDELGRRAARRLRQLGVRVRVAWRELPTRRAVTLIDPAGERTITTLGERLQPHGEDELHWHELARADGVYFTAGDEGALGLARAARVLVASPRAPEALLGEVPVDALVLSAEDREERAGVRGMRVAPGMTVSTDGARGGTFVLRDGTSGAWPAQPPPGPIVDSYGCGDSFAAGLTYGLAGGAPLEEALALAARCGAVCLTGHGPYERQLGAGDLGSSLSERARR